MKIIMDTRLGNPVGFAESQHLLEDRREESCLGLHPFYCPFNWQTDPSSKMGEKCIHRNSKL